MAKKISELDEINALKDGDVIVIERNEKNYRIDRSNLGILTTQQAVDIAANNAKVSFPVAPFTAIVDLGDVSGTVTIDWDTAIKHKLNLIGNTTLVFTNFAAYEESKVNALQLTSNSDAYTLTFPAGINLDDIEGNEIDLNVTNHLSFRYLGGNDFQTGNLKRP